ncbi:MAG: hypothetical protein AAF909_11010 [Pseudomonadota bacterium]
MKDGFPLHLQLHDAGDADTAQFGERGAREPQGAFVFRGALDDAGRLSPSAQCGRLPKARWSPRAGWRLPDNSSFKATPTGQPSRGGVENAGSVSRAELLALHSK